MFADVQVEDPSGRSDAVCPVLSRLGLSVVECDSFLVDTLDCEVHVRQQRPLRMFTLCTNYS